MHSAWRSESLDDQCYVKKNTDYIMCSKQLNNTYIMIVNYVAHFTAVVGCNVGLAHDQTVVFAHVPFVSCAHHT